MAQILDGKAVSDKIRGQIAKEIQAFSLATGLVPGLAVVLVGENPASQVYVRNKEKACAAVGVRSFPYHLPADTSEQALVKLLRELNGDNRVHGILVQLPLPAALKNFDVMVHLDPRKDVDGMHPLNLGNLISGRVGFRSCTPFGVMKMLEAIGFSLQGKSAVVVGRSVIVGKPMGMMLLEQNATVTYCHSKTADLAERVAAADVVVAAVGQPQMIKGDWIKPGAVVIDVGINRLPNGKLVGDVEFEPAKERAAWITPVPGGVGPMTITMLLWNTLESAKRWKESHV